VTAESVHDEEHAGPFVHVDAILVGGPLESWIAGDAGAPTGESLHGNRRRLVQLARTRQITNSRKRTTKGACAA
jgi:hypothetical protein